MLAAAQGYASAQNGLGLTHDQRLQSIVGPNPSERFAQLPPLRRHLRVVWLFH